MSIQHGPTPPTEAVDHCLAQRLASPQPTVGSPPAASSSSPDRTHRSESPGVGTGGPERSENGYECGMERNHGDDRLSRASESGGDKVHEQPAQAQAGQGAHDSSTRLSARPDPEQEPSRLAIDPVGDTKVSPMGHLLGGRRFRCPVFTLPQYGQHAFILARDAARITEYSDGFQFARGNKVVRRVQIPLQERNVLAELGLIKRQHRTRPAAAVYARDLFQRFGAQVVVDGRNVLDDYYEAQTIERGAIRGEVAVPVNRGKILDELRQRVQFAQAQARLATGLSACEALVATNQGSHSTIDEPHQLRKADDQVEREKQQVKKRQRLTSSTYSHLVPGTDFVADTTFGDAGVDPWVRAGSGKYAAALYADGLDQQNWMLRYAWIASRTARIQGKGQYKRMTRKFWDRRTKGPGLVLPRGEGQVVEPRSTTATTETGQGKDPVQAMNDCSVGEGGPLRRSLPVEGAYEPGTNRVHVGHDVHPLLSLWSAPTSNTSPMPEPF